MTYFHHGLSAALLLAAACGSDTADDTFVEPSRDARIESLASAACDHYGDTSSGCPGYGADKPYASAADCKRDFQSRAADLWPDDRCNRGQIDAERYNGCEASAKQYACSSGVSSFFEAIAALDDCKADKVCSDPTR